MGDPQGPPTVLERHSAYLQQHLLPPFLAAFLPPAFLAFFLAMAHLQRRLHASRVTRTGLSTKVALPGPAVNTFSIRDRLRGP